MKLATIRTARGPLRHQSRCVTGDGDSGRRGRCGTPGGADAVRGAEVTIEGFGKQTNLRVTEKA